MLELPQALPIICGSVQQMAGVSGWWIQFLTRNPYDLSDVTTSNKHRWRWLTMMKITIRLTRASALRIEPESGPN